MTRIFAPIPAEAERVASVVIGGGIDVHRVLGLRLGLILNFNCRTMREGIQRIVV